MNRLDICLYSPHASTLLDPRTLPRRISAVPKIRCHRALPRDLCNDAGGCGADDKGVVDIGEEEEQEEKQEEGGQEEKQEETQEEGEGEKQEGEEQEVTPRIGVVDSPLNRATPLQLWRPGIVPDRALELTFPRPRREGAGSSDMEQNMTSAFLFAKASGFEREHCGGGGSGDLEALAEVAANGDGSSWKSDWPAEDTDAFQKGIYAFQKDFDRIRATYLPHRGHAELVAFFYRRWKRNPVYSAWKNTDQLVGRRVAQRVETNKTRQGAGLGKTLDDRGMRRGWVVRKTMTDRKKKFVVCFPPDGSSQATFEEVSIGVLETMLEEGSATDKERTSEALDGDL